MDMIEKLIRHAGTWILHRHCVVGDAIVMFRVGFAFGDNVDQLSRVKVATERVATGNGRDSTKIQRNRPVEARLSTNSESHHHSQT